MNENTQAGSAYGRRVRDTSEPMVPHERVEYWLRRFADGLGCDGTSLSYQLRAGKYEAAVQYGTSRVPVAVVFTRDPSNIDAALRKLAWKLEEMCV